MSQKPRDPDAPVPGEPQPQRPSALAHIEAALRGLNFGEVTVTVQDGVVVQIERTERTRLPRGTPKQ